MKLTFMIGAVIAASIMGFCLWCKVCRSYEQIKLKKSYKETVVKSPAIASLPRVCHGIERVILQRVALVSTQVGTQIGKSGKVSVRTTNNGLDALWRTLVRYSLRDARCTSIQKLIDQAGCHLVISVEGVSICRLQSMMLGMAIGFVAGLSLSGLMAGIGCVIGGVVGWNGVVWALKRVRQERSFTMEQELGNLLEIVILGLRSGLSFDKAFSLYPHYFKSSLAETCALVQAQWTHGLITRSEGLAGLARSYDSSLLKRVTDSMERSLKFGTSLVDVLDTEVQESRAIRKAKLEERISKAPVKMLFPVGVLILPAMLIYIMGPILLELITGF